MKCQKCEIDYPFWYISTMSSNEGTQELCGICALAESNRIHGADRKKFDGTRAEELRKLAIAWRKKK
jgi:hypothetical protein